MFRQASKPGRTFVAYASDTFGDGTSTCYQEARVALAGRATPGVAGTTYICLLDD
jgi:hypothetical protein